MAELWDDKDPLGFHPPSLTDTARGCKFVENSALQQGLHKAFPGSGFGGRKLHTPERVWELVNLLVALKCCQINGEETPRWRAWLPEYCSDTHAYHQALFRRAEIEVITELTGQANVRFRSHHIIRTMVVQHLCTAKGETLC
jgi:hypothetical protein